MRLLVIPILYSNQHPSIDCRFLVQPAIEAMGMILSHQQHINCFFFVFIFNPILKTFNFSIPMIIECNKTNVHIASHLR